MLNAGVELTIGGEKMCFLIGGRSPWGRIEHLDGLREIQEPGVLFIRTAGHGGYVIDDDHLPSIPKKWRAIASEWSNGWGPNFYEEDCCAVAVAAHVLKIDRAIKDLPWMEKHASIFSTAGFVDYGDTSRS